MSKWKKCKLRDVIDAFIDYRGKTPVKTLSGVPLITAKVVKDGRLIECNEFIAESDYKKWMTRGFPQKNDIVLTTEAPLGQVALIKETKVALAQRIITLQTKKDICNSVFLKYYFQSNKGQNILQARATGSTVVGIKAAELRNIEINLPDLHTQSQIAQILTSFDDKIELLGQMNQTLETMAQTIFKEWFVDFNFPGFDGDLVDGLPKGWRKLVISDLVETVSKTHKFPKDKIVFLNTSDILEGKFLNNSYSVVKSLPGQAKKSIQKNDILFSEIRPANKRFAFVHFNSEDYVVSTKLMVLRSKGFVDNLFTYFVLKSEDVLSQLQILAELRSGTFPQITYSELDKIMVNIPNNDLLEKYTLFLWSIYNKIIENEQQIRTLTQLRDNLLPKLMSGQIAV